MRAPSRVLVAIMVVTLGAVTGHAGTPVPVRELEGPFGGGNFVVDCGVSHRAADDPIVFPGMPGASHEHTFFGNRTTSAFSTTETLRAGRTLCHRRQDRSAYWTPTLFVEGRAVVPVGAAVYYRRATWADVAALPNGLRMVAGDAHADTPQDPDRVFWNCEADGIATADVPACPAGPDFALRLHVDFPECWDGVHLDSPDHRSHVAYASDGACPKSHPVPIPSLRIVVRYPVAGLPSLSFSSGSIYSGHADVFVSWRGRLLTRLVRHCLNGRLLCGRRDDGPPVVVDED